MRFIRRRLVAIVIVAFIIIFGEMALGKTIAKNQELSQQSITITEAFKDIPYNPDSSGQDKNISKNPDSSITDNQKAINDFAWKVFIALNWPVDCKGQQLYYTDPLSPKNQYQKIIGQAPEAPRRWELYPSPKDVFLPNGAIPPSEPPEDNKCLGDGKGSEIEYKPNLRLTETGDIVGENESREYKIASRKDLLDSYGELIDTISLKNIDAANKIPLVDRQGNFVINEIRLNLVEFKQITENKWYDANNLLLGQNSNYQNLFQLVCSDRKIATTNPKYCSNYEAEGAMEIKAAWRVFDERNTEEEKARYYTTKRKIVSDKSEILNEETELGLIGFHIMHKTSSQGWIWSTFEHIDNAPPCDEKNKSYTLYNNECNTKNCQENEPYVQPPYLWNTSNKEPKAVTLEVSQGIAVKAQIPSQICRVNKIEDISLINLNTAYQNSLKAIDKSSVWQYYQLIGTEWLQAPELPYSNKALDRRRIKPARPPLTNVALEPYAQGVSCIVCHTSASLPLKEKQKACELNGDPKNCADFSFLMDNAKFRQ